MKTAAVFVTVVMFSSIVKLPLVYAFFTAERESELLTYVVKATREARAGISFLDGFLLENEESKIETARAQEQKTRLLDTLEERVLRILAGNDSAAFAEKLLREKRVRVKIRLEDGFDVGEIYVPSIELCFGENSVPALSGRLDGDDVLVVDFDRELLAGWFEEIEERDGYVIFKITGEGYGGGLEHFVFSGEAPLLLEGCYEVGNIEISGSDAFFIALPGETVEEVYSLVNRDGVKLDGARWALQEAVEGVAMEAESGLLTIYPEASQGDVTILAMLEPGGRILMAEKSVSLFEQPQPTLIGANRITIPLPQEVVREQYRIETLTDLTPTEVIWGLLDEGKGISVDERGRVSVSGGTTEGKFILQALVKIEAGRGLTLIEALEKEVLLEAVHVGSVDILGETQLTVPDGQPVTWGYEAVVYDPRGNLLWGEPVTWSLSGGGYGISLDRGYGLLTVDNSASSGSITLMATSIRSPEIYGSKTITLETGSRAAVNRIPVPVENKFITIRGNNLIMVPQNGLTGSYSYQAADQNGNILQNIRFKLLGEYEGISLDENGWITVAPHVAAGNIVLLAMLEEGEEKLVGQLVINIALPNPAAVRINGANIINIPTQGDTFSYNAEVLDQEGNLLEGAELTWSLAGGKEGVRLSEAGELTVTPSASAGSITMLVSVLNNEKICGSFEVKLVGGPNPFEGSTGGDRDEENPPGKEEDPPALEKPSDDNDGDDEGDGSVVPGDEDSDNGDDIDDTDDTDDTDNTDDGESPGESEPGDGLPDEEIVGEKIVDEEVEEVEEVIGEEVTEEKEIIDDEDAKKEAIDEEVTDDGKGKEGEGDGSPVGNPAENDPAANIIINAKNEEEMGAGDPNEADDGLVE